MTSSRKSPPATGNGSMTNPLGQTTTDHYQHEGFSADPLVHTRDLPLWIQLPSGKLDAFLYNRDFRLIEEVRGDLSADAVHTTYQVNLVGRRTKMTDGMGRITTYTLAGDAVGQTTGMVTEKATQSIPDYRPHEPKTGIRR